MSTHRHRASTRAWNQRTNGDSRIGAFGASDRSFIHGRGADATDFCTATGTHIITDICTCGAQRIYCPSGMDRHAHSAWIGGNEGEDGE